MAVSAYELELMALLDRQYLRTPFYGSRRMTAWLRSQGHAVNRKRVERLMQRMGLAAIYPPPRTSGPAPGHRILSLPVAQLAGIDSAPPAVKHVPRQGVELLDLEQTTPDPSAQLRF